jgi:FixJ family two-component response regulator
VSSEDPIVYVVDDEPPVLKAVARVLRIAGWKTAAFDSPRAFVKEHDPSRPGCVVLDLAMPAMDGLEIQRHLGARESRDAPRPVIFLTGQADVPDSVEAMKRGAVDFLTKPVDDAALLDAVERAVELDLRTRRSRAVATQIDSRLATLTPREREVMVHVVSGELNKQIAAALGITEKTVKVHRARVMQKMGAQSLAELVRLADAALVSG